MGGSEHLDLILVIWHLWQPCSLQLVPTLAQCFALQSQRGPCRRGAIGQVTRLCRVLPEPSELPTRCLSARVLPSPDSLQRGGQTQGPLSASPRNKRRKRLFKEFPPSRSRAFPLILLHESNWLYWVSLCPGILRNMCLNS